MAEQATRKCGATAVFWPDDEACDAECILPRGHQPTDKHEDEILGEWTEDELNTWMPEESHPATPAPPAPEES